MGSGDLKGSGISSVTSLVATDKFLIVRVSPADNYMVTQAVMASALGLGRRVNVETLAADKTLTSTSEEYQILKMGGANRILKLHDPGTANAYYSIAHNGTAYSLTVTDTNDVELRVMTPGERFEVTYDGSSDWVKDI